MKRKKKSKSTIPWDEVGLGERPDAEIAREIGRHVSAVGQARRERGIPPAGKLGRKPANEDEAALYRGECGAQATTKFKDGWICDDCLLRDNNPLRIEDFVRVVGATPIYQGDVPTPSDNFKQFSSQLSEAMAKRGIPNGPTPRALATAHHERSRAARAEREERAAG